MLIGQDQPFLRIDEDAGAVDAVAFDPSRTPGGPPRRRSRESAGGGVYAEAGAVEALKMIGDTAAATRAARPAPRWCRGKVSDGRDSLGMFL
jgi:hypothetical protein